MSSDALIRKLAKLLALARQGIGGERGNAQERLDALLAQHGLTLADIEKDETVRSYFKYRGADERRLLEQIFYKILKTSSITVYTRRGEYGIDVTRAQALELSLLFTVYGRALKKALSARKRAFKKELELLTVAFVLKNDITGPSSGDDGDESSLSSEDLDTIVRMARSMEPTPVPRGALGKGRKSL